MKITVEVDVNEEWISQVNGGISVEVSERGFHSICEALEDVGDVGDVQTVVTG